LDSTNALTERELIWLQKMYDGKERRADSGISEELIEHIAERAAKKVLDEVYRNVGKGVIRKTMWVIGVGSTALAIWLAGHGYIK